MDALAGYRSDSSSDGSGSSAKQEDGQQQSSTQQPQSSLAGLLGGGASDSSDDEEGSGGGGVKQSVDKASSQSQATTASKLSKTDESSKKRQRLEESEAEVDFLKQNSLPKPMIMDSSSGKSMPYFQDADYISKMPSKGDSKETLPRSYAKFEQLKKSLAPNKSWASHLQEQKEFNNPHFFQSVVEYFGIAEPLGSHMNAEKQEDKAP